MDRTCWNCRHYPDYHADYAGTCNLRIYMAKWDPPYENKCAAWEYEPGTDEKPDE